jgi:Flp pilus assembly protein TadG
VKGATAVEFALVATPLLAQRIAMIQTTIIFFAERTLNEVVIEASEPHLSN